MIRRKRGLIALLLLLALVVAACGGGDDDDEAETGGGDETEETTGGDEAKELEPGQGFDGTTITLGVITAQTGPAAVIGNQLLAGNQVFVDALNAKGGIAGKYKIKLEVRDSQFQQPIAVQAYSGMKGNVAGFVQVMGTSINKALLPQYKTDGFLVGPASLDSDWIREPNLLAIGAPYQIQAINGIDYYIKKGGGEGKKLCTMTMDDAYGQAGLAGAEHAAEELGVEFTAQVTFKAGDSDFTGQLNQLKGCDAVWYTGLPTETAKILAGAAQAGFAPRWLAQSPTYVTAFSASGLAPYMQKNYWIMSDNAPWGDTSIPGMKQMLDDVAKHKPDQKPDGYFQFGYSEAWAFAQVLEQAVENGDLSPKGILEAAAEVDELEFGDSFPTYSYGPAEDRDPPRLTNVYQIDPPSPGGTKILEKEYVAEMAESFTFE